MTYAREGYERWSLTEEQLLRHAQHLTACLKEDVVFNADWGAAIVGLLVSRLEGRGGDK